MLGPPLHCGLNKPLAALFCTVVVHCTRSHKTLLYWFISHREELYFRNNRPKTDDPRSNFPVGKPKCARSILVIRLWVLDARAPIIDARNRG